MLTITSEQSCDMHCSLMKTFIDMLPSHFIAKSNFLQQSLGFIHPDVMWKGGSALGKNRFHLNLHVLKRQGNDYSHSKTAANLTLFA